MIRKQARDLCGRDVGRMVSATCDRTGLHGRNIILEILHHGHQTSVLLKGSVTLILNPQTIVRVTGV